MHSTKKHPETATRNKYYYQVQLASHAIEPSIWGEAIPAEWRIIQLLVPEPTREAIELAVIRQEELNGFFVVDYWQEETEGEF